MRRTTLAREPTLPPGSRHQWGVSALLGTSHRVVGVGSATGYHIRVQSGGPQGGIHRAPNNLWREYTLENTKEQARTSLPGPLQHWDPSRNQAHLLNGRNRKAQELLPGPWR
jgi:hypothetical protein